MRPLPDDTPLRAGRVSRSLWLALGLLFVLLGFIGALLPLMPTTIFLILAAGCFTRSSPRLESWLLSDPRFGSTLRAWREDGAMGRRAKVMACSGIALGYALFVWSLRPGLLVDLVVAIAMAGCAAFIIRRPALRGKDGLAAVPAENDSVTAREAG